MKMPRVTDGMILDAKRYREIGEKFGGSIGLVPNNPDVFVSQGAGVTPYPQYASPFGVVDVLATGQKSNMYKDGFLPNQDVTPIAGRPIPAFSRAMAPVVPGSDVPGATKNAPEQLGSRLMPASDLTGRIDAAMLQNVPPPQNVQPMAVSPEARGMSTSIAGPGAGPQRDVPPPRKA